VKATDWRAVKLAAFAALALALVGCSPGGGHPSASPSPSLKPTPPLPGLLGLAGESPAPLRVGPPYLVEGNFETGAARVESVAVPATGTAAVTALVQALGVPGPPISTATGLGYNLDSTSGYQLTTDPNLDTFNYHPNAPTDEVGTTPTLAIANQFAEAFLAGAHLPSGGGVSPLPQLSFTNGSDRTVYFQWTLLGLPVVNILGQPEEIDVDVARDQFQVLQLVGISGSVPYGAIGKPVTFPAMQAYKVVQYLNSGVIKPGAYLLSPSLEPFPSPSPAPLGPLTLDDQYRAIVDSYGTAVPVYVFQVSGNRAVGQFVTCAVPPAGCVPLRFRTPTPSPSPSPST
jgi:hypothetical protein